MLYVGRLQTAHGTRVTHRRDARLEACKFELHFALTRAMAAAKTDCERCEADPTYVPAHEEDSLQAYMGCWGPYVLRDVSRWLAFNTDDGSADLAQLDEAKVPDLISFIDELGLDFGSAVEECDLKTITSIVHKRLPRNYQTMRQRLQAGNAAREAEMKEMCNTPQSSSDEEEQEVMPFSLTAMSKRLPTN